MSNVIVQTSQIDFLLKCVRASEIDVAMNRIWVLLEFPLGFVFDLDAMKEFFEEPFQITSHSGPIGEILYSAKGTIKDPLMSELFIQHILTT